MPSDLERNPARITLSRDHADFYAGGRQIDVTVRINASRWEGLTAMGLYEQVPPGWTFAGARSGGGPMPGVLPPEGAGGVLQFVWINQSRTPIAFQYTLNVPPKDHGSHVFSGQVEYRLSAGQLTSNVALSRIEGVADEDPVITLLGPAAMTLATNAAFQDPGARATDEEDGDLTSRIETSGQVDTSEAGTYTITYGVMDSVGNRAEPVVRRVIVQAAGGDSGEEKPGTGGPGTIDGRGSPQSGVRGSRTLRRAAAEDSRRGPAITVPEISLGARRGGMVPADAGDGGASDQKTDLIADPVALGGGPAFGVITSDGGVSNLDTNLPRGADAPDGRTETGRSRARQILPGLVVLAGLGAVAIAFWLRWTANTTKRRHPPTGR